MENLVNERGGRGYRLLLNIEKNFRDHQMIGSGLWSAYQSLKDPAFLSVFHELLIMPFFLRPTPAFLFKSYFWSIKFGKSMNLTKLNSFPSAGRSSQTFSEPW